MTAKINMKIIPALASAILLASCTSQDVHSSNPETRQTPPTVIQAVPDFQTGGYNGSKPKNIYFGAGGDQSIFGIVWTTWNASEAIGQGYHASNNCTPDCAAGSYTYYPDIIRLYNPIQREPEIWGEMTETYDGQTVYYIYPDQWSSGAS